MSKCSMTIKQSLKKADKINMICDVMGISSRLSGEKKLRKRKPVKTLKTMIVHKCTSKTILSKRCNRCAIRRSLSANRRDERVQQFKHVRFKGSLHHIRWFRRHHIQPFIHTRICSDYRTNTNESYERYSYEN